MMVVPQALAYATIAGLPYQYGLFASFCGVFVYCGLGTSKDVTVGPTAIMSLLVSAQAKVCMGTGKRLYWRGSAGDLPYGVMTRACGRPMQPRRCLAGRPGESSRPVADGRHDPASYWAHQVWRRI